MTNSSNEVVFTMESVAEGYIELLKYLNKKERQLKNLNHDDDKVIIARNSITIVKVLNEIAEERICLYRDMIQDIQYVSAGMCERVILNLHKQLIDNNIGYPIFNMALPYKPELEID